MTDEIKQYIRNKRGERIGVVLAQKVDEKNIGVGWSLCCKKDKYDEETALLKARGRAKGNIVSSRVSQTVPKPAYQICKKIHDRAVSYFKNPSVWPSFFDEYVAPAKNQ